MKDLPEDMYRQRQFVICPHCGEEVDELIDNVISDDHKFTGCEFCGEYCGHCGEKTFHDEMHPAFVYEKDTWRKSKICDNCWNCYNDDPATYDLISEEDPHAELNLFDTLHKNFEL